jgi:hypothetical protein
MRAPIAMLFSCAGLAAGFAAGTESFAERRLAKPAFSGRTFSGRGFTGLDLSGRALAKLDFSGLGFLESGLREGVIGFAICAAKIVEVSKERSGPKSYLEPLESF